MSKERTILRNQSLISDAKFMTIKELSEKYHIGYSHVSQLLKQAKVKPVKKYKFSEYFDEARNVCKQMTIKEFYDKYGVSKEGSIESFRTAVCREGISFKRSSSLKGATLEHKRKKIDIGHLKTYAHEYSFMEYYDTFKPDCARNTLKNRAKELGIEFKKDTPYYRRTSDSLIEMAREESKSCTFDEFYEKHKDETEVMKLSLYSRCLSEGIHFKRNNSNYKNAWTEEEIGILKKYYPEMGTKCVEYLPNRNARNIAERACKLKIKCKNRYWNSFKHAREITDPITGKVYPSVKKLCEAYNIPYERFNWRLNVGWDIEKALTTPSTRQK